MGIFDGLFRSRDKPENRTAGSAYTFFFGGSTAGKLVTEGAGYAATRTDTGKQVHRLIVFR